ncbi:GspMb/PilO family protein [Sphaerotilaceae bacterium SBD11-9]
MTTAGAPSSTLAAHARRADPRAWISLAFWRHGLWLPLSLAMLALAAWMLHMALSTRVALRQIEMPAAVATVVPANPAAASAVAQAHDLQAWREVLVPVRQSTDLVRRLVELTQPDLAWQRAQFQQSDDQALGVVQLRITVPVKGEYRQMRKALDRVLLEMPNLSLDQVMFRRQQASDSQLEAQLRFSLWLQGEHAPAADRAGGRP